MTGPTEPAGRLALFRGLRAHLERAVLGQEEALRGLSDALLAGEMGHARPGRPRSMLLLLGPTGTGKTKAVKEASAHLFGTGALARLNGAEFASAERVPLLLGRSPEDEGLLAGQVAALRRSGGRILLIDEVEKAHPSVADHLLGIEDGAVMTAGGRVLDLSDLHVVATSNVGSSGVVEMEGLSRASVRRFVEQEAAAQFRPEVFARFTAVLVFGHLSRDVQMLVCRQMLEEEASFQEARLAEAFGHPHSVRVSGEVCRRLVGEGWHRRLGARPMRNVVERRVRAALVDARLGGALGPGVRESVLCVDPAEGLSVRIARAPISL